ncbi:hypothetical protein TVAG_064480 [Trichomonas vaginalis G3]|uniref:Uncharacterized protein n=1 Tax=Trichomonas vaginalis (strain ATCC PRA-98 / G3) TaxID=412133 RepID=A2EHC3_TRIV3|nr:hypothetical protein TVAGG3_0349960 [Trichomonas vaginalis G3]EAY07901.1 hypothetical protein TVAG_064480 [Trichomonas vaginalis G3]KAI5531213.1 hypothetical protein TVAGG3_0349960 [Trichomonas vaginalis G3]|eukprot:XP_001320124.1 hypothetical protein [Trichomonas vaginalis G3]
MFSNNFSIHSLIKSLSSNNDEERCNAMHEIEPLKQNNEFSNFLVNFILDPNEKIVDRIFLIGVLQYNNQVLGIEHFEALNDLFNLRHHQMDNFLAGLFAQYHHNAQDIEAYFQIQNKYGSILCITKSLPLLNQITENSEDLDEIIQMVCDYVSNIILDENIEFKTKYEAFECINIICEFETYDLSSFYSLIFQFYSEITDISQIDWKLFSKLTENAVQYSDRTMLDVSLSIFNNLSQLSPHSDKNIISSLINIGYVIDYSIEEYSNEIDLNELVISAIRNSFYSEEDYYEFKTNFDYFYQMEIDNEADEEDSDKLQAICFKILEDLLDKESATDLLQNSLENSNAVDTVFLFIFINKFDLDFDPNVLIERINVIDSPIKCIIAKGNFIRYVIKKEICDSDFIQAILNENNSYLLIYLLDSIQENPNLFINYIPALFYQIIDILSSFNSDSVKSALCLLLNVITDETICCFTEIDDTFMHYFEKLLDYSVNSGTNCATEVSLIISKMLSNDMILNNVSQLLSQKIIHFFSNEFTFDSGIIIFGTLLIDNISFPDTSFYSQIFDVFCHNFPSVGFVTGCVEQIISILSFGLENGVPGIEDSILSFFRAAPNISCLIHCGSILVQSITKNVELGIEIMKLLIVKEDVESYFHIRITIPTLFLSLVDNDKIQRVYSESGLDFNQIISKYMEEMLVKSKFLLFIDEKILLKFILTLNSLVIDGNEYQSIDIVLQRIKSYLSSNIGLLKSFESSETIIWQTSNFMKNDYVLSHIQWITYKLRQFIDECICPFIQPGTESETSYSEILQFLNDNQL